MNVIPQFWQEFVEENNLMGREFELSEQVDLSKLGADLKIMTWAQAISESTECHPGIEAAKLDYFPIAICLAGSGDYYYISKSQGRGGPLYRIYHESVVNDQLDSSGIETVLDSYEKLLKF